MSKAPVTDGIRELQSEVAALAVDVLTDLTDERNALKAELLACREALARVTAAANCKQCAKVKAASERSEG